MKTENIRSIPIIHRFFLIYKQTYLIVYAKMLILEIGILDSIKFDTCSLMQQELLTYVSRSCFESRMKIVHLQST